MRDLGEVLGKYGAGMTLPDKQAEGQCDNCGKETLIFPETGRCEECEIDDIRLYLSSQQP